MWSIISVFCKHRVAFKKTQVKVKVNESNPYTGLERSWGFQEVKAPRFQNNRHMKVALAAFTPQEVPWYPFLLETESTPGPKYSWKDYVNEKFQWHYQESKPRPSGL